MPRTTRRARERELERELAEVRGELEASGARIRELETALARTDLSGLVGLSTGDIVHELRNPLFGIEGFATLAQRNLEPTSPALPYVERIVHGAHVAGRALTTVAEIARPEDLEVIAIPALEVVADAISVARAENPGAAVEIVAEVEEGLRVAVDSRLAKEAVLHLVRNAVEAGASCVRVTGTSEGDDRVSVAVVDDGEGIRERDLTRVMRLFVTTRPGADGVGLPRAQRVALLHGGGLQVESSPAEGTRATLLLPKAGATR